MENKYMVQIENRFEKQFMNVYEDNVWQNSYMVDNYEDSLNKAKSYINWLKENPEIKESIYQDETRHIISHRRGKKHNLVLWEGTNLQVFCISYFFDNQIIENMSYQEAFQQALNYKFPKKETSTIYECD